MGLLSWLFGKNDGKRRTKSTTYTLRQGKPVRTDAVFHAWTSGNLNKMLTVANAKTNPIDRHFLLQAIVAETYKRRKEAQYRSICIEYAERHLEEFPSIAPALKKDMGGTLPRVTTFQHYATVLTEDGEYAKAISVCERAVAFGLHDGTKAGFEGRIARIRKKAKKG